MYLTRIMKYLMPMKREAIGKVYGVRVTSIMEEPIKSGGSVAQWLGRLP